MRLAIGLLADYANVTADGKLNIMGVFNVVNAPQFPFVLPLMHLVVTLEAYSAEIGHKQEIEVKLMSPDGAPLFAAGGELEVPRHGDPRLSGMPVGINHIIGLQNLRFERPGDYHFAVLINREVKEPTISLKVLNVSPTPPPNS